MFRIISLALHRGQRAKSMKFRDGYMIAAGDCCNDYIDYAVKHIHLRQGVLGIKVKIMLPHDPTGETGVKKDLPDHVVITEPKQLEPEFNMTQTALDSRPQRDVRAVEAEQAAVQQQQAAMQYTTPQGPPPAQEPAPQVDQYGQPVGGGGAPAQQFDQYGQPPAEQGGYQAQPPQDQYQPAPQDQYQPPQGGYQQGGYQQGQGYAPQGGQGGGGNYPQY